MGRGHGARGSNCTLHPSRAEGSQPPGKKLGWWVGPRRRHLPALVPHPAPPFQQARRPGIPWGLQLTGCASLGRGCSTPGLPTA